MPPPLYTSRQTPSTRGLSSLQDISGPERALAGATIEQRIDFMLDCTKYAGFENFENLAAEYYTGHFDEMSQASEAQRMSRSRGLPLLLEAVGRSAHDWPKYESQSYEGEIFRSAEALLERELKNFAETSEAVQFLAQLGDHEDMGISTVVDSIRGQQKSFLKSKVCLIVRQSIWHWQQSNIDSVFIY